jgi:hypothetical protein
MPLKPHTKNVVTRRRKPFAVSICTSCRRRIWAHGKAVTRIGGRLYSLLLFRCDRCNGDSDDYTWATASEVTPQRAHDRK